MKRKKTSPRGVKRGQRYRLGRHLCTVIAVNVFSDSDGKVLGGMVFLQRDKSKIVRETDLSRFVAYARREHQ